MTMPSSEFGEHPIHMRLVLDVDIRLLNRLKEEARETGVSTETVAVMILRDTLLGKQ